MLCVFETEIAIITERLIMIALEISAQLVTYMKAICKTMIR